MSMCVHTCVCVHMHGNTHPPAHVLCHGVNNAQASPLGQEAMHPRDVRADGAHHSDPAWKAPDAWVGSH